MEGVAADEVGVQPAGTATATYVEARLSLLADWAPGGDRRRDLSALTDEWLGRLFADAVATGASTPGLALVAVGSYGTGELSPGSDLDLLLLHTPVGRAGGGVGELADALWYPVWDSGVRLDHSVRTPEQARALASRDVAVLLGLLDSRTLAGDPRLLQQLRTAVLADWRADARRRLPELRQAALARAERHGELAYALEPDLKLGRGGLRDLTVLRAVAASWVADRPHTDLAEAHQQLLEVRDALHLVTGRPSDRLSMQEQQAVADRVGMADADDLMRHVCAVGRTVAYAADVTWGRVEHALRRTPRRRGWGRGAVLRPIDPHMLECDGELVLAAGAATAGGPYLAFRAAATAARTGLSLSPRTVRDLGAAPMEPGGTWPADARAGLVSLLAAGTRAIALWEALDSAGLVVRLLPEWSSIRHKRQRNAVHGWTVDRHSWETAAVAASMTDRVARPDLLLLAALLHDLGKGMAGVSHAAAGEGLVRSACARLGLSAPDAATVAALSRDHLLLIETAMHKDVLDPAIVSQVVTVVRTVEMVELLAALTEADARATGPGVWTAWKAGLVDQLVTAVRRQCA